MNAKNTPEINCVKKHRYNNQIYEIIMTFT